ncbi:hypothetical protein HZB78_05035 [Candidatus Collierbacteria bacterium]|nr:hypothetical protein [Candidatus Collierbacteria bacterium]
MNKIIFYIIALIILALAGEGGYYLGVNAGKRIGVQETLKKQSQQKIDKTVSSTVIPTVDKSAIEWVKQVNSLPLSALWNSTWQATVGGRFISINNKSIVLEINNEKKTLNFPVEMTKIKTVKFSQYNVSTKEYIPNSLKVEDLQPGDSVAIELNINTLNGKINFLELSKQTGKQIFN